MSFFRMFFMMLDKVVFSLIDDGYNLMFDLSKVFVNNDLAKEIIKNFYIIVGIFAFFKIAVLLVNSIIDPEKLNEKGKGLSSILWRTVAMLVILVLTPFIFDAGYDLQSKIMDEQIIEKLILGTGASGSNPGNSFKTIAISSLITVNEYYSDDFTSISDATSSGSDEVGYASNGTCKAQKCEEAITKWNEAYASGNMNISDISPYITVNQKNDDGDDEYVYDYMVVVTTFAGGFIVYMLFSFAIDIAIRVFKLAILEIISPLFIVTFIDPKSTSSGMFSRWLKEVGNTYVNLFIKVACISLTILFVSLLNNTDNLKNVGTGNFVKLTLMLGLLVFAKQAPKLISELLGIKSDGNGLGIGKKLASAALIGGAIGKGLDAVKNGIGNVAKKGARSVGGRAAGRLAGTAAARRVARDRQKEEGSLRDKYKQKKATDGRRSALGSYFSEGRKRMKERAQAGIEGGRYGAVSGLRAGAKAKNAAEVGAIFGQTYKGLTSEAGHEGVGAKISGKMDKLEADFKAKAVGSDRDLRSRREEVEKRADAEKLRANNITLNSDGKRDKLDWANKFEMDAASKHAQSIESNYNPMIKGPAALPQQMIMEDGINHGDIKNVKMSSVSGQIESFEDKNGNIIKGESNINKFISEYGNSKFTMAGNDAIKANCDKNAQEIQNKFIEASKKVEELLQKITGFKVDLSKLNMDKSTILNGKEMNAEIPVKFNHEDGSEGKITLSIKEAYEKYMSAKTSGNNTLAGIYANALNQVVPYQFNTLQSIDSSIDDVNAQISETSKSKALFEKERDDRKNEMIEICKYYDGTNKEYKQKDNPLANADGITLIGSYDESGNFVENSSMSSVYSFDSAIQNTQIKVNKSEEKAKKSLSEESEKK